MIYKGTEAAIQIDRANVGPQTVDLGVYLPIPFDELAHEIILYDNGVEIQPTDLWSVNVSDDREVVATLDMTARTTALLSVALRAIGGADLYVSSEIEINNLPVNCAWCQDINTDGSYVVGNGGTYANDPFVGDTDWGNDVLYIAALNTRASDVIEWQYSWTGGGDGYSRPIAEEIAAKNTGDINIGRKLKLTMRETSPGSQNYQSGVLEIRMIYNGVITGDVLTLLISESFSPYSEYITWSAATSV